LGADAALAMAAPLGLLGGLIFSLRMSLCSIIPHWADRFAEEGNIEAVARSNWVYSQPFLLILYAVPVALAAWLGSGAVGSALDWIGAHAAWAIGGLYTASGMLSALGIALNLRFLFRGNVWPYFFIGFCVTSLMDGEVNLLVMSIIAAGVAYVHVLFTQGIAAEQPATATEEHESPGLLTRRDVFQAFLRWLFFSHSTWNWERMQGLGFAHSMTPIIEKLYKTQEDVRAALKRHLVFFNTQPDIGGVIHGAVIAMEEERAAGADIGDDAINAVKTGLMGPLAGIGDTLQQGIVIPIALSIGIGIARGESAADATGGSILGPLVYLLLIATFTWGVGWLVWWQGYRQGRAAVTNLLRSGALNRVIVGAGVVGNFIMGALAVGFVSLSTPVGFTIGGAGFEIQSILDSLMPNLLPLMLVMLIWWLLAKKNVSPTLIMLVVILAGLLGAIPIWPGIDAETGEGIKVGVLG